MSSIHCTHARIQRIEIHNDKEHIQEYELAPGQGILFYKLGKSVTGDKFEIFRKAQSAFNHNLMEIFGIHDEQDGLLLSPSLDHQHANVAYNDSNNQSKLSASLVRNDRKIKYIGSLT